MSKRKGRKTHHKSNHNVVDINYMNKKAKEEFTEGTIKKTFNLKDLIHIQPKTSNQKEVFKSWSNNDHILLKGSAGTGKTFLAMYLALREVLDKETSYDKVIIVRSTLPVRDQGFLPGTEEEKSAVYELPYNSICNELFKFSKSYSNLKASGYVEFMSTSYIRGITLSNAIVIVDESQNLNDDELSSIITRCGQDTRFIFAGDTKQSDAKGMIDRTSLERFERIIGHVRSFDTITFTVDDVVRSGLVKEWIIASEEYS